MNLADRLEAARGRPVTPAAPAPTALTAGTSAVPVPRPTVAPSPVPPTDALAKLNPDLSRP